MKEREELLAEAREFQKAQGIIGLDGSAQMMADFALSVLADREKESERLRQIIIEAANVLIDGTDEFEICGASSADHHQNFCACPALEKYGRKMLEQLG